MATRGKVIDASIQEIRRVWNERGGTRWMNPEPQDIPIWVGGRAEVARRRAARLGDGWLPYLCSPRWFGRHRALLEEDAAELGRDHATITKAVVTFVDLPSVTGTQQGAAKLEHWFGFDPTPLMGFLLQGTAEEVGQQLAEYVAQGATEVLVVIANDRPFDVLEQIVPTFAAATSTPTPMSTA